MVLVRSQEAGSVGSRGLLAVLLLVLLASASVATEEKPKLVLRAQATVDGREVLLGDIAEITAVDPLRERLGQVSLGSGPLPGTQRTIKEDYVKLRLRRFGVDPATLELSGGPVLVISGRAPAPPSRAPVPTPAAALRVPSAATVAAPAAPLVKRGQLVAVTVTCGGVTVQGTGRAQSDGAQDELIKVSLEGNNRSIVVRVVGAGEATCLLTRSMP